jgi:hypothetical protein
VVVCAIYESPSHWCNLPHDGGQDTATGASLPHFWSKILYVKQQKLTGGVRTILPSMIKRSRRVLLNREIWPYCWINLPIETEGFALIERFAVVDELAHR